MNQSMLIASALRLPAPELEALAQGRMISFISKTFIAPNQSFAIYPGGIMSDLIPIEQCYRSDFLSSAKAAADQNGLARFWARCEFCKAIDRPDALDTLSQLTIWAKEGLQAIQQERQFIFLTCLRVYQISQPIQVMVNDQGKFSALAEPIMVSTLKPSLSDEVFSQRRHQLETLTPPLHSELEQLHSEVIQLSTSSLAAKELEQEIRYLLDWTDETPNYIGDPDLLWIQTIADTGNSSDGDKFEKLVRKGFIKLGFSNSEQKPQASLDPNGCGGAGGLDFYCEQPYQIVGECKATKTELVPDGTPAQLIKLGHKHLEDKYHQCIKIIMAAGELNSHAKQTAIGNTMNVLRPETLQRLVELKAKHKGAINLLELKPCLENKPFGEEADVKVNNFIDKVWSEIRIRSNLIKAVKKLTKPHAKQIDIVAICTCYNLQFAEDHSQELDDSTVHELLKELSSPLTGYLGRAKGEDGRDRFYFLRDLAID
jgi:hypothetical protein